MKVLITGVAGFIGSNLLDYLLEKTNWEITGIDNLSTGRLDNISHVNDKRFTFVHDTVRNIKSLKEYQIIFHLAALPRIQPSFEMIIDHVNENLINTLHLVELMIKENHYPRFVNSSSSAVYGTPRNIPTTEDEPFASLSPYAYQKEEVERYFDILSTRYPLNYVHLRYFNPYGPRSFNPENKFNAYSSVVGIFLYRFKHNLKLQITGDGLQRRDFIHVADLASANYLAAIYPHKLNTAFNIGFGSTLSVLELAKMISDNYEFIPKREGEAEITFADISKAQKILGWKPTVQLHDYIRKEISQ
ncbi:MAG: GDP-mannose 4,6-dehydratase [Bacteroidia bacterium]|nr:GDP-mannose 4,6-dehydratase [Bacteroidia bacterium]